MDNNLIDWVERQLKIKGFSQRQLADKVGVSNTFISDVLRGRRSVTFGFCQAIAKGLNEPIWNVLMMAGLVDDVPDNVSESEETRVIISKYGQLSKNGKEDVSKYLDWVLLKEKG
jgi:transcriptional regulator with XRE-family HTH domain